MTPHKDNVQPDLSPSYKTLDLQMSGKGKAWEH